MTLVIWLTALLASAPSAYDALQQRTPEHAVQVARVHRAMELLASQTHPKDLQKLMALPKWQGGASSQQIADAIARAARRNQIDPLLLVSVAWRESGFRTMAKGDCRGGVCRACGPTQVRTDIKGHPTCDQLMEPYFAFDWTAGLIAGFPRYSNGTINMAHYNGPKAAEKFWAHVDWMKKRLAKDQIRSTSTSLASGE